MPNLSKLTKDAFHTEMAAFRFLEATLWPDGAVCPHCGTIGKATRLQTNGGSKDGKRQARLGLWKCNEKECRKQFTVKVGTVFEHGRIPLHKMLQAVYLLCCSKKGCSSHQLHRILGITYKAAWFLSHRIREAMRAGEPGDMTFMGGEGQIVEVDETYFGNVPEDEQPKTKKDGRPFQDSPWSKAKRDKRVIISLVERGGEARSFHAPAADKETVVDIVLNNIYRETQLHTDESNLYYAVGKKFAAHETVNHSAKEYARGDVTTNTVEGFFSIFKRGMTGVYQHCAEKHLHRYLAEFDFRYNNRERLGVGDEARTTRALRGVVGKRLTYRRVDKASGAASA